MPDLPKAKRVQVTSGNISPVKRIPTDIGSAPFQELSNTAKAFSRAANAGINIWKVEQTERDNNYVNSSVTSYQEKLLPEMEKYRQEQGKDTDGNIDRYNEYVQKERQNVLKDAPKRVHDRLNQHFNLIDYHNQRELARIRSKGQEYERNETHSKSQILNEREVFNNPEFLRAAIAIRRLMYQDEVKNKTMDQQTADAETYKAGSELTKKAIDGIIEKEPPEIALIILKQNKDEFSKYLTTDEEVKYKEDIKKREQAMRDEAKRKYNEAKTFEKEAKKKAQDAAEKDLFFRVDDPDISQRANYVHVADLVRKEIITPEKGEYWNKKIESTAKGEKEHRDIPTYTGLEDMVDKIDTTSTEEEQEKVKRKIRKAWGDNNIKKDDYTALNKELQDNIEGKSLLKSDAYKYAIKRLEEFEDIGGYLPDDIEDDNEAYDISQKTLFEKKQQLKRDIFSDPKIDINDWINKNLKPAEEEHKKNMVIQWLEDWWNK